MKNQALNKIKKKLLTCKRFYKDSRITQEMKSKYKEFEYWLLDLQREVNKAQEFTKDEFIEMVKDKESRVNNLSVKAEFRIIAKELGEIIIAN